MKSHQNTLTDVSVETDEKIIIKDVIVADPSISIVFIIASEVLDFQASFFLDNLEGNTHVFKLVARVSITQLPKGEHYISVPFGDNRYEPGTKFTLVVEFQGQDPITRLPVTFPNNPRTLEVISGGIVK